MRALLRDGADVNRPRGGRRDGAALGGAGSTVRMWPASCSMPGADPTAANAFGATPLGLATVNGSAAMLDTLLRACACSWTSGPTPP